MKVVVSVWDLLAGGGLILLLLGLYFLASWPALVTFVGACMVAVGVAYAKPWHRGG